MWQVSGAPCPGPCWNLLPGPGQRVHVDREAAQCGVPATRGQPGPEDRALRLPAFPAKLQNSPKILARTAKQPQDFSSNCKTDPSFSGAWGGGRLGLGLSWVGATASRTP